MINVSNNGSAIIVKASEGEFIYPSAKTELELPMNSVILTLDESEMAVFRSAANFDVLFTALIDNLQINGASVTKTNIADKFADVATSEGGGSSFKYEVVDELPSEGENGTIYLVPNAEGTHTEYLYVENVGWEQVGTAEVDLSNYYTKDEVDEGNKVNAAAFNTLQKSIGLNENLETLSGKSIQAQIDELKEGGSSNAYEKVEGIEIVSCSEDGCETSGQVGIIAQTLEDGKWNPEFYLTSDEDWSSHIGMNVNDSDAVINIWSADGNDVEIHSNRLAVYPSEGENYDIMYSDIVTKDNQNYQIVDSFEEITAPQEGMMVYKKGEAQKIDIVTTDDVYYSYFKDFSNEIYIQVEDALFNANGEMFVEIGGTPIFQMNTEEGLVIFTDNKGFLYFDGEDSLRYDSATFNYSGSEYTFNFALTTIGGKKCVKMTVATPDNNLYFSTSSWYQNMGTPIFYLGEPTEGETYQYVEGNWKEPFYDKVEGIDILDGDYDAESQITIASYTYEDGTWNPTVELRCDTDNGTYIGMYGGAGEPFFDVMKNEENGGWKETWFDYEKIGWFENVDGEEKNGEIYYKDIKPIVTLTQSEYDALEEKDPNTVYLIKG